MRPVQSTFSKSILIVEDSELIRHFYNMMMQAFRDEGFTVFFAANGKEALHQLLNMDTPRLILLDLNMPEMNGLTFLKYIKSKPDLRLVPVVVLSSEPKESLEEALRAGAIDYLQKPFTNQKLQYLVRRYLYNTEPGGGPATP